MGHAATVVICSSVFRVTALLLVLLGLIAAGTVYAFMKPTKLLGVSKTAVDTSFKRALGDQASRRVAADSCSSIGPDTWRCGIETDPGSGSTFYDTLHFDGDGCWRARPQSRHPRTWAPFTPTHGCIRLLDYTGIGF